MRRTGRRLLRPIALFALALCAGAGCGGGREFAEVGGTITFDGQPLGDVEVVFLPDSLEGNGGNNAGGYTDEQGRYKLRSPRDGKDGTVLGRHRVIVVDLTAIPDVAVGSPPPGGISAPKAPRSSKPRFPQDYSDPLKTPFKDVEVKSGKQTLDFDLKSKGP
jgi:hypothetical protein